MLVVITWLLRVAGVVFLLLIAWYGWAVSIRLGPLEFSFEQLPLRRFFVT